MNSKDITSTEGRFKQSIDNAFTLSLGNKISQQITNAVENERIKTGVMTKFYQYLDRVEVKVDGSEDTMLCRILHRFGGELIDFYTPTGEDSFCDILKEPCVIPRGELHCCILNINDDTDEWLMLGYFNAEELIGVNPAAQGNIKIVTRGGTNQFWVKFGYDGLDIRSLTPASVNVGETDEEMTEVHYADSDDTYSKEEVYNKTEVDELITGGGHGTHAVGSFSINENGHLIVQIPDGMSNPYSIDDNGHLIYDTSATNNGDS